jgi:sulfur relay protein TusB/DsrH
MTTLFILNRADAQELRALAPLLRRGDALLLIEEAVYLRHETPPECTCFALREDLLARGIAGEIPAALTLVSYDGFVALCLRYARAVNW